MAGGNGDIRNDLFGRRRVRPNPSPWLDGLESAFATSAGQPAVASPEPPAAAAPAPQGPTVSAADSGSQVVPHIQGRRFDEAIEVVPEPVSELPALRTEAHDPGPPDIETSEPLEEEGEEAPMLVEDQEAGEAVPAAPEPPGEGQEDPALVEVLENYLNASAPAPEIEELASERGEADPEPSAPADEDDAAAAGPTDPAPIEGAEPLPAPPAERVLVAALQAEMTQFPGLPLNTALENELSQVLSAAANVEERQTAALRVHVRDCTDQFKAQTDGWIAKVRLGERPEWPPRRNRLAGLDIGGGHIKFAILGVLALIAVLMIHRETAPVLGSSAAWGLAGVTAALSLFAAARRIAWWMLRVFLNWLGNQARGKTRDKARPAPPFPWGKQAATSRVEDEPYKETEEDKLHVKLVQEKRADKALYETTLRVVLTKELPADFPDADVEAEQAALERVAQSITGAVTQAFVHPQTGQSLNWLKADPIDALYGLAPVRAQQVPPLVLNSLELSNLIHVFDDTTQAEGVRVDRAHFRPIAPKNELPTVTDLERPKNGIAPIGVLDKGTRSEKMIGIPVRELDKHAIVLGRSGSGKSTLAEHLVNGSVQVDYPVLVLDPHNTFADAVVRNVIAFCPERVKDLVIVDLGDDDHSLAYNPLDVSSEDQIDVAVQQGETMLASRNFNEKSQPRAIVFARQAMKALAQANLRAGLSRDNRLSLLHIGRFFSDSAFRHMVIEFCTFSDVTENFDLDIGVFEKKSEREQQEIAAAIQRVVADLESSKSIARVFASGRDKLNIPNLLGQGKIVVVKLGGFGVDRRMSEMLAGMILPGVLGSPAAYGRFQDPRTGEFTGRGARIFIDEAAAVLGLGQNAASYNAAMAQLRKLDIGLIAISQFLGALSGMEDDIRTNTATKIAFALDPKATGGIEHSLSPTKASDYAELERYMGYATAALKDKDSGTFGFSGLPPLRPPRNEQADRAVAAALQRSRDLVANRGEDMDERLQGRRLVELPMAELHRKLTERIDREGGNGVARPDEKQGGKIDYDAVTGDWADMEVEPVSESQ